MNQLSLLFVLALSSFTAQAQWTLIWSDEFGGNSLDTTKWVSETGGWGWGNNELQYYTDGDNLTVSGGALIIEARTEQFGSNSHTSGKIITKDIFEVQYGKIETRLKVPMGKGLWPAFWMLGENIDQVSWPFCGEIDVMEHVNTENAIHGTAHWHNGGHVYNGNSAVVNPSNYQTYTIEWNENEIRWFLNGSQYHFLSIANGVQSTDEFHLPFYLILNLAVGGNWPGSPDTSTPFPSQMEVDYVRVYQLDTQANAEELETITFSIYPNPAKDILTLETSMNGQATISTLNGCIVSEQEINAAQTTIALGEMETGMYFVTMKYENGRSEKRRFVKE